MKVLSFIFFLGVIIMPVRNYYISAETEKFFDKEIDRIIEEKAKKYDVRPTLIRGIINAESGNVIFSVRNDTKALSRQKWAVQSAERLGIDKDKYKFFSGGLMHPLYLNAVNFGFKGSFYEFLNPEVNIEIGVKILKGYLRKYKGDVEDAVSAYNMGSAKKKNGKYVNQDYVDKVMNWGNL